MTVRNHILMFFIVFCFGTPLLINAQNFEGVIHYEIPEMSQQNMGELLYLVKDAKVRMEFGQGSQKGALLLLPEESKIVFIIDAAKSYMSVNRQDDKSSSDEADDAEVTKTGQTKTIAGKACEVWKVSSSKNLVEACMAKGMGTFMIPQSPMGKDNTPEWARELMEGNLMPLEVIEIKNGKQIVRMRANKIEEKSLSADLFVIPEDYNDMSNMMKQMQQRKQN